MKLRITLNDKTFEVDVEVAEADTAALPPAYPIGSAVLSGSVASGCARATEPMSHRHTSVAKSSRDILCTAL